MSVDCLKNVDGLILAAVQENVPLTHHPFVAIAEKLELPDFLVLERLRYLKNGPKSVIRQIGAIFDSQALGYRSTLVAAKIPQNQLDAAAAIINQHPGVSHNYRREHEFNLWYTLAVPPTSRLGLEATAQELHRRSGAVSTRILPALKLYKIGVKLDVAGASNMIGPAVEPVADLPGARSPALSVSKQEMKLVRVLQQDLPLLDRPFSVWADEAGVESGELLEAARRFRSSGIMRRFSAVLRHRELGFAANGMGVWIVPPEKQDEFGALASAFPQVSHCYLRPSYADWPFNFYTMVHARRREEVEAVLKSISNATGVNRYTALFSTHEFKKVRLKYFTGDIEAWEAGVSCGE